MHDGGWHHLCARWRNSEGKWCVHVNGDMTCYENYKTGQTIPEGNGKFYLGQEQDSYGIKTLQINFTNLLKSHP